jgi:small subunit ribosomal protein S18
MAGEKKKRCYFKSNNILHIDYKDVKLLQRFMTDAGKILPRRITGVSALYQRKLVTAIKQSRHAGLVSCRRFTH